MNKRMIGEDKITDGSGYMWNLDFLKIFTYTHDMKAAVRRERPSEKEGRRLWRRTI